MLVLRASTVALLDRLLAPCVVLMTLRQVQAIPSVLHAQMVSTLQQELARAPTALRASTWYPVRDARLV